MSERLNMLIDNKALQVQDNPVLQGNFAPVDIENSFDQLEKVKKFAVKHKIILLIKRHNTAIINSDGMVWFNSTGNNALAKAGSGDVLTGIICGFLAQGYAPLMAAQIGVFVHGKNADDFIKTNSPSTFSPEKQIENLPKTLYALGI